MSSSATLNSRLRILVAKAFRAEKLYAAARASKQKEAMPAHSTVSDAAQELRAKEWQKSHYDLRVSLNTILALGNNKEQASQLLLLKARYQSRAEENAETVKKLLKTLKETADRQEFAHVLKLALELIRLKAVTQSSKVITEELHAVLSRSGRASEVNVEVLDRIASAPLHPQSNAQLAEDESEEYMLPENVVSLAERRAVRGR